MNAVGSTVQKLTGIVSRAATMTTEAAGAIGGAAVNGVIGGVKGAVGGAKQGMGQGSHSTPAAALTLGALGVAGLVEWPVLAAVGGTALVLQKLNTRAPAPAPKAAPSAPLTAVKSTGSAGPRRTPAAKKATAQRSTGAGSRARTRH